MPVDDTPSDVESSPSARPTATDDFWRDLGSGSYLHTTQSKRFPVYTRGNAGEVFPNPYHPLTFSMAARTASLGMQDTFTDSGIFGSGRVDTDFTAIGVLGGYGYLNLSLSRVAALRYPGGDLDQVDEQVLGRSAAAPHRRQRQDRRVRGSLAAVREVWTTMRITELPELVADKRRVETWRRALADPSEMSDFELLDTIEGFESLFADLWHRHISVSGRVPIAYAGMTQLCEQKLGDRSLALSFFAGIGDVESAAPALGLWQLGRMVAAHGPLDREFDRGVEGILVRLEDLAADDPAVASFQESFAHFLDRFGSRGPNEWDSAAHTWGTKPEIALALVDRMRGADESHDPARQQARLAEERATAIAAARASLGPVSRRIFNRLLVAGTTLSQGRERAKTTIVSAIQESRVRIHELGRRVAERAADGAPDDIFYVTREELRDYLERPDAHRDQIVDRRAMRDRLCELVPPFIVDGEMPPIDTWERRDAAAPTVGTGEVLTGLGGCPGKATGRARIVLDPADPGDLGPGDVLVAPITDPAWTPLFVPAEAVVVDVGALISHAVIVSRELGIPAAVSVTDASKRIPDGALIEVDGTIGTVTVLELP